MKFVYDTDGTHHSGPNKGKPSYMVYDEDQPDDYPVLCRYIPTEQDAKMIVEALALYVAENYGEA